MLSSVKSFTVVVLFNTDIESSCIHALNFVCSFLDVTMNVEKSINSLPHTHGYAD